MLYWAQIQIRMVPGMDQVIKGGLTFSFSIIPSYFFFFNFLSRAASVAHGSSQARDQSGPAAEVYTTAIETLDLS